MAKSSPVLSFCRPVLQKIPLKDFSLKSFWRERKFCVNAVNISFSSFIVTKFQVTSHWLSFNKTHSKQKLIITLSEKGNCYLKKLSEARNSKISLKLNVNLNLCYTFVMFLTKSKYFTVKKFKTNLVILRLHLIYKISSWFERKGRSNLTF